MTSPHGTKTNDMENQTSKPKPQTVPGQEASGDRRLSSCSASFEIFELRDFALRSLPKKELARLLTLVGEPPTRSIDRQRELMALRLARYADAVTITVRWDSRMPNVKEHAPLSAGASVDHEVVVGITDEHVNRAADRGCCVSTCSASSFFFWHLNTCHGVLL